MTMVADWNKFTDKQRRCIAGYIKHGNKTKAYREAYDLSDPKSNTSRRNCQLFFRKPHIMAVIEQIQEEAVKRSCINLDEIVEGSTDVMIQRQKEVDNLAIDASWVLQRAALLADFNIRKFVKVDDHGNAVYDFSDATDDDWYCIQEYTAEEIARGQNADTYHVDKLKIKTYDKLRALELVGKHIDIQAFKEVTKTEMDLAGVVPTINVILTP